jgi:hypothetical protein
MHYNDEETPVETFNMVKDVIESITLKELRLSNIYAALELGAHNDKPVRITYHSDSKKNNFVDSPIKSVNEESVSLKNFQTIPIRAIKKIEFFSN